MSHVITKLDVDRAQRLWAEALIEIGRDYTAQGDYKATAKQLLDQLYAYHFEEGVVLFKPTYAQEVPFRQTYEAALSYFVGGDAQFEEDQGFALRPWQAVEFMNEGYYFHGDTVLVMGGYVFKPIAGEPVKAEYTFGYVRDQQGDLKIILHHSSC